MVRLAARSQWRRSATRASVWAAAAVFAAPVSAVDAPGSLSFSVRETAGERFGEQAELSAREHELQWRGAERSVGRGVLRVGFDYEYTRFEYEGLDTRNRDLHRMQLPVDWRAAVGEWTWHARLAPGVATSSNVMKDLLRRNSGDDWMITGDVVATRSTGAGRLSIGVAHDRRFGRSRGYPVLALRDSHGRWTWQAGVPDTWIDYRLSPSTRFSAGIAPDGMQWHTVRDDFRSNFEYRLRRWRVGLDWHQRLVGRFWLGLHVARPLERLHRFELADGSEADGAVGDGFTIGVTVRVGAPSRGSGYAPSRW